jgi:hypothetical protein
MNDTDNSHLTPIDPAIEAAATAAKAEALDRIDKAIEARAAKTQEAFELSTPHGRMRRHWPAVTRAAHPTQVGKLVALLDSGEDKIDQLVKAVRIDEALREADRVTDKIRYGGFTTAKPVPLQSEVRARELNFFGYQGVFGRLFNTAGGLVKWPDSQIERIDWWTIRIDGKDYSHEELCRQAGVRHSIPTRKEIERLAETDFEVREILRRIDAR